MTGSPPNSMEHLAFDDISIDVDASLLLKAGEQVPLGPRPLEVLFYLIENRGRVVAKQELFDKIWGVEFVTDAALAQAIKEVRLALGDDAHSPKYVRTVHRKGYQFIAPLSDNAQIAKRRRRKLQIGLGLCAVVFLAGALSVWIKSTESQYPPNSIAVLPFVNMSDDPGNEYFSDGIAEELLNLLARIPELRVIARTSSFSYKGKDAKVSDIARELKVRHVLEGSVRKAGNQIRITAQLIDADSETHLWSGNYDRTLEDIFAVQDEIAGHVVDALQVKLLGKEAPKMKVTTPEGYALYLQGMYFAQTVYDYTKADEYLRQSLAIDPGYAPAWSGLSMVRTNQCIAGLIGYHEGYQQSREYASRALKLDPNFGDAQSGLGWIAMMYDRDLPTAAFHFRRALALAPNDARILGNASTFAETLGRFDRAIELAERSLAIDPLSSTTYGNTAAVHCYLGQFDLAHRKFRKARELSPGDPFYRLWQAKCYLLEGEPARALEVAEQIEPESRRLWTLPMAYHDLGQEQTSDEYLNLLKEKYADEAAAFIAENHAWRGEIDQAFEWLNRAIDEKQYMWGSLVFDPAFSNLHSDARWNEIRIRDGRSEEQLKKIEF